MNREISTDFLQNTNHSEKEHEALVHHLDEMNKILEKHLSELNILTEKYYELIRKESTREIAGPEGLYYVTPQVAIQVATSTEVDFEVVSYDTLTNTVIGTTGYQRERVRDSIGRKAPVVHISNDGTTNLFVRISSTGLQFSPETVIIPGEVRTFYNVWEVRLRSGTVGNLTLMTGGIYRFSEYPMESSKSINPNRASFITRRIIAPIGGTSLPIIAIPDGFALVVTANPLNTAQVYVANLGNSLNAGNRITLNAGDTVKLYITNSQLVEVAGSAALPIQYVDIIVEQ